MAIVWDRALFESLYRSNGWPYGVRHGPNGNKIPTFHYHWRPQQPRIQRLVNRYLSLPGFDQVSDVAIVGGGFGWTAEVLANNGINVISVETGDYVANTYNTSEEGELRELITNQGLDPDNLPLLISPNDPNTPASNTEIWDYWLHPSGQRTSAQIVFEDLSTNGSRRNVRQALGNNIDAILSEFVIDSVETEADALVLIERCEQLRPNPACTVIHMVHKDGVVPEFIAGPLSYFRNLLDVNGYTDHWVVDQLGVVG